MNAYPDEFVRFLERPVPKFLHLASVRKGQSPICCRGYAARAEYEQSRIWIYILRSQWLRLHEALQPEHWLAVLLTSGVDNESYQVKGQYDGYRPFAKEDHGLLEQQRELTLQTFPQLASLHTVNPVDCFAIGLKAAEVYSQTPGPQAGFLVSERSPRI
ncbi:hypothetical protein [Paenibacillus piri]|uniref:Pyridoxamine 5'-phosphate oxidase family protein n=1 Tax=Paenibacillus piri TaxID=2547395 RepID=A0A4R5KN70_9BACL|nr:hypothetical protein [Paenibacillus piri]TDF97081.1 hypothetical protein E1757_14645 [Paenibacillus piri]